MAIGAIGVLVLNWTLFTFCSLLAFLRFWVQLRYNRKTLDASDYWIMTSLIITLAGSCLTTVLVTKSLRAEQHPPPMRVVPGIDLTLEEIPAFMKLAYFAPMPYFLCLWAVKSSFLSYYYSLVRHMERSIRMLLHVAAGYLAVTFIATMCVNFFWCLPIRRNWTLFPPERMCFSLVTSKNQLTITYVFNITTDLMILSVPIWLLITLNLRRRERLAVVFVCILGCMSMVAATGRYAMLMAPGNSIIVQKYIVHAWTEAETAAGLVASCLPAFRVFMRRSNEAASADHNRPRTQTSGKWGRKYMAGMLSYSSRGKPSAVGTDTELLKTTASELAEREFADPYAQRPRTPPGAWTITRAPEAVRISVNGMQENSAMAKRAEYNQQ